MQMEAAILQNLVSSIMAKPEEKNETSGFASTSMPGEREKGRVKFLSTLLSVTGEQGLSLSTEGPFPLNSPASEIVEGLKSFVAIIGQKMTIMNDPARSDEKMHENLAVLKNVDTGDLSAVTNCLFRSADGNHHSEPDILKIPEHFTESVEASEKAKNEISLQLNLDKSFMKGLETETFTVPEANKSGHAETGPAFLRSIFGRHDTIANVININTPLIKEASAPGPEINIGNRTEVNAETEKEIATVVSPFKVSKTGTLTVAKMGQMNAPSETENPDTKGEMKTGSDDLKNVKQFKDTDPEVAAKSRITEHSNKDAGPEVAVKSRITEHSNKDTDPEVAAKSRMTEHSNKDTDPEVAAKSRITEHSNKDTDPGIAVKSRMTEHSNKGSFSEKTEMHQIHEAKASDSDKGATGGSGDSNNKGFRFPIVNPDSSQQSTRSRNSAQKNPATDLNMGVKQIIKTEFGAGEESTLSSNHQSSEKNISAVLQSKDVQHSEKSFQPTIMKQVVEKAILSLKNGQTSIKLSLRPDVLGRLKMHISTENRQVSIRIITEVPMVKEVIESNMAQLRTDFQKQGLELEKFDISVGQGSTQNNSAFERSSSQGKTGGNMDGKNDGEISDESRESTRHVEKHDASNLIDYFA